MRRGITSDPSIYREIVVESGAKATIDIGHARGSDYVLKTKTDLMEFVRGSKTASLQPTSTPLKTIKGTIPSQSRPKWKTSSLLSRPTM